TVTGDTIGSGGSDQAPGVGVTTGSSAATTTGVTAGDRGPVAHGGASDPTDATPDPATDGAGPPGATAATGEGDATADRGAATGATTVPPAADGPGADGSGADGPGADGTPGDTGDPATQGATGDPGAGSDAGEGWADGVVGYLAVAAGLGLAGLGVVALVVAGLRLFLGLFRSDDEAPIGPVVRLPGGVDTSAALDRLRHELEAEPEPGAAVLRAYAVVESGFGNVDLARRPSESSFAYLDRALGFLDGVESGLAELTGLFLVARYSTHPVSEEMRRAAIDAVIDLRSRYRVAVPVIDDPMAVGA
ncbi:MAG: DUF4129 domain-containing protein, partial [Acidimicrobiales bacterium]